MTRIRSFAAAALVGAGLVGYQASGPGIGAEPPLPTAPQQSRSPQQAAGTLQAPPTPAEAAARQEADDEFRARFIKAKPENVLKWRAKYPYRSLADRLSYEAERAPKSSPPLQPDVAKALDTSAQEMTSMRSESFRLLHEEEVEKFVNRSGFGFGRMERPKPGPSYFEVNEPEPIPLAKVAESAGAERRAAEPAQALNGTRGAAVAAGGAARWMPTVPELQGFHAAGAGAFADPWYFGYVKSVDQVAGFAPHAFHSALASPVDRAQPEPPADSKEKPKSWQLVRLELTSLLKHDVPRVYVSENLPRMEELATAPTRELTKFEAESLAKLEAGEETVVAATANRIEMFGALRASKQCAQCHEVPVGTLLGAFSYDLRRDPPVKTGAGTVQ